ncbi:hypothetical protein C7E17_23145, partial [Stenotrophomonas maltophilia]
MLLANNLLLATACAMVLLGTLYPLLADALSLGKISVGPPYFGSLFLLLMAPMILLLPFGPLVKWQRDQPSRAFAETRAVVSPPPRARPCCWPTTCCWPRPARWCCSA